jgi:hypothetical protein
MISLPARRGILAESQQLGNAQAVLAVAVGEGEVRGVGVGERLSVVWPGAQASSGYISEHTCDPLALLAALFPDRMLALVMGEVERMANDPLPVAQRAPRVAALEGELDDLHRVEAPLVAAAIAAGHSVHPPRLPCSGSGSRTELRVPLDELPLMARAAHHRSAAPAALASAHGLLLAAGKEIAVQRGTHPTSADIRCRAAMPHGFRGL